MKLSESLNDRIIVVKIGSALDTNIKFTCGYIVDVQLIEDIQKLEAELEKLQGDTNAPTTAR